jgi:hypothetical protein
LEQAQQMRAHGRHDLAGELDRLLLDRDSVDVARTYSASVGTDRRCAFSDAAAALPRWPVVALPPMALCSPVSPALAHERGLQVARSRCHRARAPGVRAVTCSRADAR